VAILHVPELPAEGVVLMGMYLGHKSPRHHQTLTGHVRSHARSHFNRNQTVALSQSGLVAVILSTASFVLQAVI
jgi:hypothetical protein